MVGVQMYDLNGDLLGKLATGDGSLPVSFKNLIEGKIGPGRARIRRYARSADRSGRKLIGTN